LKKKKNPKKKKKAGVPQISSKKAEPKPEPKPAIEEPTREITVEQLAENQAKIAQALTSLNERLDSLDGRMSGLFTALTSQGGSQAESAPQKAESSDMGQAITGAIIAKVLKGEEKDPMTKLADVITKARTISDALNPPTVWDRVLPMVVVRALTARGLMTKEEAKMIEEEAKKAIEERGKPKIESGKAKR